MMRCIGLIPLFLTGLAASLPYQTIDPNKPDIVRRGVYDSPETGVIEGIGVCSIEPDSICCWDMKRKPLASLENAIRAKLIEDRWRSLSFKFGKKNRYLAVGTSRSSSANVRIGDNPLTVVMDGRQVQLLHSVSVNELTEGSQLVVMDFKPKESELITFKVGAKFKLLSLEWEVLEWSRNGPAQSSTDAQSYWFVRMAPLRPSENIAMWNVKVYDWAGNLIEFVDKQGKSVSKQQYLQINADAKSAVLMSHAGMKILRGNAIFDRSSTSWSEPWNADTNIDPAIIGSIGVSVVSRKTLLLTGFPLDP